MHGFRNSHQQQNSTTGHRKKYPFVVSVKRNAQSVIEYSCRDRIYMWELIEHLKGMLFVLRLKLYAHEVNQHKNCHYNQGCECSPRSIQRNADGDKRVSSNKNNRQQGI